MDYVLYIETGLFLICMVFSGFFSSSETSLFSLDSLTLEQMRRDENPRIDLISRLLNEPRRLIVTILIGNELVNVAASVISAAIVIRFMGAESKWVNIFVMVPILLLFGEITPKTLAIRHNVAFATFQSTLINAFARLITPVRWLVRVIADAILTGVFGRRPSPVNIITEDMVRSLTDEALGEGTLDRQEARYIENIFDFGDLTAEEIITPRSDFFALEADSTLADAAKELHRTRHTKVPVLGAEPDEVAGVLYARDLIGVDLSDDTKTADGGVLRKPYMVPGRKQAADLFEVFRQRKLSFALVIDEYGGVIGLITLEDLLECIFGDIRSLSELEKEREIYFERLAQGDFQFDGAMPVKQFNNLVGREFLDDDAETMGGLLLNAFDELPADGSRITLEEADFTVLSVEGQRIAKVRVRLSDAVRERSSSKTVATEDEAPAEGEKDEGVEDQDSNSDGDGDDKGDNKDKRDGDA